MDVETKEVIARAELPKLFRNIRLALGLSQERMSELSGISRVQISYYETADSVPTMGTFNKYLKSITKEIKALRNDALRDDKKYKYTRMAIGGSIPRTQKEKESTFEFLEKTGFIRSLLTSEAVILKERKRKGKAT